MATKEQAEDHLRATYDEIVDHGLDCADEEPIVFRGKAGNRQFKAISKAGDEWLVLYQRTGEARPESCLLQDWEVWCKKRGLRLPEIGTRLARADGTMATVLGYEDDQVIVGVEKQMDVAKFLKTIKGWEEGIEDDDQPTIPFQEAVAQ